MPMSTLKTILYITGFNSEAQLIRILNKVIRPMSPVGNRQSKMIKEEAGPTLSGQLPVVIKRLLQVFLHYPEHQRQSP